jgi:hypothetical protein
VRAPIDTKDAAPSIRISFTAPGAGKGPDQSAAGISGRASSQYAHGVGAERGFSFSGTRTFPYCPRALFSQNKLNPELYGR